MLLADSVTALSAQYRGCVLVSGSHGGLIAARYALAAGVAAALFNDAGGGLDDAGVAGLALLDDAGVPAAAVAHLGARIGDARTTAGGTISRLNELASKLGVTVGMACGEAVARMRAGRVATAPLAAEARRPSTVADKPGGEGRRVLAAGVVGLDSIGLASERDAGLVLVIGSHCELHGGEPASALPVAARAALFHDAGLGAVAGACTRLPVLDRRGIPGAAVDARSARIGDARSMWETGTISAANAAAGAIGVAVGDRVREAVAKLLRGSPGDDPPDPAR